MGSAQPAHVLLFRKMKIEFIFHFVRILLSSMNFCARQGGAWDGAAVDTRHRAAVDTVVDTREGILQGRAAADDTARAAAAAADYTERAADTARAVNC